MSSQYQAGEYLIETKTEYHYNYNTNNLEPQLVTRVTGPIKWSDIKECGTIFKYFILYSVPVGFAICAGMLNKVFKTVPCQNNPTALGIAITAAIVNSIACIYMIKKSRDYAHTEGSCCSTWSWGSFGYLSLNALSFASVIKNLATC